ncbi:hypothetical protein [Paenibacillus senegalimassiliensis]|uniref:hypothetical protein n=1 Tax=Paenibacillus senegalimassiliensis TaxID=1737426 RepID=UPI00073EF652|nr:hypothetical protein [Paenibacillus senegalimassiliensis]
MEKFEKNLLFLKDLIKRRVILPHPVSSGDFYFRYDEKQLEDELKQNQAIDSKLFLETLNKEVGRYILAIYNDSLDALIRFNEIKEEDEKKEELLREKINLVQKHLIDETLLNSFKLKESSKNNLLKNMSWELNSKLFDVSVGTMDSLNHITLDLITTTADNENPLGFFNPFVDRDTHLVLSLTVEDIDYLLLEFNKIKRVIINE